MMERTSEVNEPVTRPGSAETASIKDGMETPPPSGSNRSTSPISCAICLGACVNTSFTETCLHRFCFTCLVTWSKVKAECPLCKQMFRSIIHNVQSDNQYEVYNVQSRSEPIEILATSLDNFFNQSPSEPYRLLSPMLDNAEPRFRYRTTLTLGRRESLALQHLLSMPPTGRWRNSNRGESQVHFRRTVYRLNLWAQPLPDFTGRFRDCTPEFYRTNPAQVHRLVPWLTRELSVLLNDQPQHINYVLARILEILPEHTIRSDEFRYQMENYLRERTDHFIHELYNFASSPYDLTGYDGAVQYVSESRVPSIVNEIISSSDDGDSDVQIISTTRNTRVATSSTNQPSTTGLGSEIVIETIDHSDSDDSASEVVMVGYVKPPQDRTPEIVDLLHSDSDVVLEDDAPRPSTSGYNVPLEMPLNSNLVKLSLTKRQTNTYSDKPKHKKRKRMRLSGSSTASDDSWNASVSTGSVSDWSLDYDSSSDSTDSYYDSKPRKGLKRRKLTSTDTTDTDELLLVKLRKKKKKKQKKERKHSTEKVKKSQSKSSSRRSNKYKKYKRERKVKKGSETSPGSVTGEGQLVTKKKNSKKTRRRLSDRSQSDVEISEDCNQPGPSWRHQSDSRVKHYESENESNAQSRNYSENSRLRSVVKVVNSQESGSETERYTPPNTPPSQTNYSAGENPVSGTEDGIE